MGSSHQSKGDKNYDDYDLCDAMEQSHDVGADDTTVQTRTTNNTSLQTQQPDPGDDGSLSAKIHRFFRRIQKYEAFAQMDDQEMMDRNYSISFTDGDGDSMTLTTNTSSIRGSSSLALAHRLREQSSIQQTSSIKDQDEVISNVSCPLTDWDDQMSRSILILGAGDHAAADTDGSEYGAGFQDESVMVPQFNVETGEVEEYPRRVSATLIPDPPTRSCISRSFGGQRKKTDPKRLMIRRAIYVLSVILVASCTVVAALILTDIIQNHHERKQNDTYSDSAASDPVSSTSLTPLELPSPSLSPSHVPTKTTTLSVITTAPSAVEKITVGDDSMTTPYLSLVPLSNPSSRPSSASHEGNLAYLQNLVARLEESLRTEAVVPVVVGTPQYEAIEWLAADPDFHTYSDATLTQRYALTVLDFVLSRGGETSRRIRSFVSRDYGNECQWFTQHSGPICDNGALTILDWSDSDLEGEIPPEIGLLGSLQQLVLSGNNLKGSLPKSIGALVNLRGLYLQGNQFDILPDTLGQCINLEKVDLSNNSFVAMELPFAFGKCTNLQELWLDNNQFFGTIHSSYYNNLTALRVLSLENNTLDGAIHSDIRQWTEMRRLSLNSNKFSSLPDEITNLRQLQFLDLRNNHITEIPNGIIGLENAHTILLGQNWIDGAIPNFSPLWQTLEVLDLSDNDFSGNIPWTLGYCTNLKTLLLNSNSLSGGIHDYLKNLENLNVFRIDDNNLTKNITSAVCNNLKETIDFRADCRTEGRTTGIDCPCCSMCCLAKDVCVTNPANH